MERKWAEFGQRLKKFRKANGLSQRELLAKLEEYGIYGEATISRWERGWSRPKESNLDALEEVLGVQNGVLCEAALRPEYAEYRRMLIREGSAVMPGEDIELRKEQLGRDSKQEIGPSILKAQEEHLADVRELIEEWRDSLYTPAIEEAVADYHHPISDVEDNLLFEHLKEHLPSPSLWLNYSFWSYRIDSYLFECALTMRDVGRDNRFWVDKGPADSGGLVWVNTEDYAYHVPIIKRISSKALDNLDHKHRIAFEVSNDQDEHEGLDKSRGSYTKTWIMYVDGIPVGECVDQKIATETYEVISDYYLKHENTRDVIILFRELKSLEGKIHQDIAEDLAYQDYRWYNCQFCKNYHFPDFKKQRYSQWTEQSIYTALIDEHFKSLIPASRELIARLKILISFREQWSNRGVPTIEGNIVDGCFLINPTTKEDWPVHYSQFPNPLDNSQKLRMDKPMDSLGVQCLLEHFNHQFRKLAYYNNWRDLSFSNLHPTLLRKICSWLENEEFRQYEHNCHVCWVLKKKFGKDILL